LVPMVGPSNGTLNELMVSQRPCTQSHWSTAAERAALWLDLGSRQSRAPLQPSSRPTLPAAPWLYSVLPAVPHSRLLWEPTPSRGTRTLPRRPPSPLPLPPTPLRRLVCCLRTLSRSACSRSPAAPVLCHRVAVPIVADTIILAWQSTVMS
jgi:hypothetical protein